MSDKPQKWTAEKHGEQWALVYDPTPNGKTNPDGTVTFGWRFPALYLSEYLNSPKEAAEEIAEILNKAEAEEENP